MTNQSAYVIEVDDLAAGIVVREVVAIASTRRMPGFRRSTA